LPPRSSYLLYLHSFPTRRSSDLYHLTAQPWKPLAIPRARYLDAIEGICRFSVRHQNADGAIIDPFLNREHQYATPYFAYAVGTQIGRATSELQSLRHLVCRLLLE